MGPETLQGRVVLAAKCYAQVVVRLGHRFLLVQERKKGQAWTIPGGRVESGETFVDAARRETLEETGVPVVLEGVLHVAYKMKDGSDTRVRIIFVARPEDDTPPKLKPDRESLGAGWFGLEEIDQLSLRGPEIRRWLDEVCDGALVHPLSLLAEG